MFFGEKPEGHAVEVNAHGEGHPAAAVGLPPHYAVAAGSSVVTRRYPSARTGRRAGRGAGLARS